MSLGNVALADPDGPDPVAEAIVRRRLAAYQARLDQVHARGGDYAKVEFSDAIKDLLLRLDAGDGASAAVH